MDNLSVTSKAAASHPSPTDFDTFLPWACFELSVEVYIYITRGVLKQYVSTTVSTDRPKLKKTKSRHPSLSTSETNTTIDVKTASEFARSAMESDVIIMIETFYDAGNLVQLKFLNNKPIPRQVFKIIGLIIPFHKYLTSITINSGLQMESMYEISNILPISNVTELCLDNTFLVEANYHILLSRNSLKHLSIARCKINDEVVKTIASKLEHPLPASKTLSVLNLSTNWITDIGAKYLADMLRTNRQLSYLNIADNMISDIGGITIFNTLRQFPMTAQELAECRERFVTYLKKKSGLISSLTKEIQAEDLEKKPTKKKQIKQGPTVLLKKNRTLERDLSVPAVPRNRSSEKAHLDAAQFLRERIDTLAEIRIGLFKDPFINNMEKRDDVVYCLGNNTLCYLNLAYNDLTHISLKVLCEVLSAQKCLNRSPKGLANIRIEGNFLPEVCKEYEEIDNLLASGLEGLAKPSEEIKKKSSIRSAK